MDPADFVHQALSTWRVNNSSNLLLLQSIPREGLLLEPNGPRARNIARIFAHMHQARIGWVRWHDASAVADMKRFPKDTVPSRSDLKQALKSSAHMVEAYVDRAFQGQAKIKWFQKQPARFLIYLIMHEAHHRGQIIFALKHSGMRLPAKVTNRQWEIWFLGKE
jgi:uncharacterized damage-inducible protein DinB